MRFVAIALLSVACSFTGRGGGEDATQGVDTVPGGPCLEAWCRRRSITVDPSEVIGGPHAQFPILIDIAADASLADEAREDGFDILFTEADGVTKLAYERARFDGTTGQLVAWVAVPNLASTTVLYMYWGNAGAQDQQNAAMTWDSATKAVWHLDGSQVLDSTVNANHGVGIGTTLGAEGLVAGGASLDGIDDSIRIADSPSLDEATATGTIATWIKWTDAIDDNFQSILTSGNTFTGSDGGYSWGVQSDGDLYFNPWNVNVNNYNLGVPTFSNGTWHHVAVTLDFASREVALFVDGSRLALAVTNTPTFWRTVSQPTHWLWGGNPDRPTQYLAGSFDEIRVASMVRSEGWIATEVRNQRAPTEFVTLGPVEALQP